jgi:hypothetical protein
MTLKTDERQAVKEVMLTEVNTRTIPSNKFFRADLMTITKIE